MHKPAVIPPPSPSNVAIMIKTKSMQRLSPAIRMARKRCRVLDPSAQRVAVSLKVVFWSRLIKTSYSTFHSSRTTRNPIVFDRLVAGAKDN
jgi:hypothetical protein